ncbi:MAG: hypothetical protein WDA16_08675 [Candidatus Thermoplasmatota archaeon]
MEATKYFSRNARALLRDLQAWGLVTVVKHQQGRVEVKEIRLTRYGAEAADHAIKVETVALEAKKRGGRGPKD